MLIVDDVCFFASCRRFRISTGPKQKQHYTEYILWILFICSQTHTSILDRTYSFEPFFFVSCSIYEFIHIHPYFSTLLRKRRQEKKHFVGNKTKQIPLYPREKERKLATRKKKDQIDLLDAALVLAFTNKKIQFFLF